MFIYIVRHAWAGQHGDPNYPDDSLRPLTDKGKKRFRRVVKKLVKRDFHPAAVATSSLVRARQTADIISEYCPAQPRISILADLSPGGRLEPLLQWTREQSGDVAWVGHAPDVGYLVAGLLGGESMAIHFPKGACAAIYCDGPPSPRSGELVWFATAELMRV